MSKSRYLTLSMIACISELIILSISVLSKGILKGSHESVLLIHHSIFVIDYFGKSVEIS